MGGGLVCFDFVYIGWQLKVLSKSLSSYRLAVYLFYGVGCSFVNCRCGLGKFLLLVRKFAVLCGGVYLLGCECDVHNFA